MVVEPQHTLVDILHDKWWIAAVAFLVSVVLTPIVRFIAYQANVFDRPDDALKPHERPTPYLGGVAMMFGLLAGLLVYAWTMPDAAQHWTALKHDLAGLRLRPLLVNPLWNLSAIGTAAAVITLVGLLDDLRDISPVQKISGQIVAASILLLGGVGHRMGIIVLGWIGLGDVPAVLVPISAVAFTLLVISTCNATNLLDGLDGLCGGVTGIIALGFMGLGLWLAIWGGWPDLDALRVVLCLAMAGAVLGFLLYNVPPASIFMGDAGSMLLGLFVATMMALFCQEKNPRWFIAACVVFSLPILDTTLAVVRRLLMGRSIFAGDRSHLYDQLVDRGLTVKQVVALFYLLAALTSAIAVAIAIYVRVRHAVPFYILLFGAVWAVFYRLGMITPSSQSSQSSSGE